METKWMRFLEMSAQALALVSVWRSASAMVTHGAMNEPLGLLQALEPLTIPATVLAVIGSIAATQIRLRGRRKLRKIDERSEPLLPVVEASSTDRHEQIITELRNQVAELSEERERLNRLLQEKTLCLRQDPLTGIANRLAYEEQLQQEFHRWQRFGNPLTFLIWDVDHFKQINDSYGHAVGDEVLCNIASQLGCRLRSTDFVARYGGEEFAMLLPGADIEAALQLANQIRLQIAEAGFNNGEYRIPVTISCGVTRFEPGDSAQTVFKRADHALYQAKKAGRNCCWMA
jgi:diguanylate cyclase (GGDEF)-like protein